jgi:Uma2 family endonuclease
MGFMATEVRQAARHESPPALLGDTAGPDPVGQWPEPGAIRDGWRSTDLAGLPDDGLRYEILDGVLLVSPAPSKRHQRVLANLYDAFRAVTPTGHEVYFAPLDWRIAEDSVVQPDLLVVPAESIDLPVRQPLVVVEILSPSTSRIDRTLKFQRYAEAGAPQYWIVDPAGEGRTPTIDVYDLADGAYALRTRAADREQLLVDEPVPIAVTPADLIA